jgi:hypothetical protein
MHPFLNTWLVEKGGKTRVLKILDPAAGGIGGNTKNKFLALPTRKFLLYMQLGPWPREFLPYIYLLPSSTRSYNCNPDLTSPIYQTLARRLPPPWPSPPPHFIPIVRPHRRLERNMTVLIVGHLSGGSACLSLLGHRMYWRGRCTSTPAAVRFHTGVTRQYR